MRVAIRKTPKLYIGGAFVRSESGRTYRCDAGGATVNVARASKKDARDAVRSARAALAGWSSRTAYNRGQILYRLAEMLEARREEFGVPDKEIAASIDRVVWYAGWCDKIEQVLSTKNPVAGPHFNVSAPEPTGVVAVIAPSRPSLLGIVSAMLPPLCGANTIVVVASNEYPLAAIALAEAVATSDVQPGAINILTGRPDELVPHLARHMDVNALSIWSSDAAMRKTAQASAAENMKRVYARAEPPPAWWLGAGAENPRRIADFMEIKTVWHPAGV